MDSPKLESRGWFLRVSVIILVVFLLLVQSGGVRGEAEASHGYTDRKNDSVLEQIDNVQPPKVWAGRFLAIYWLGIGDGESECKNHYGIMPCSKTLGGNAVLMFLFGFFLFKSGQLLSDGSELLLEQVLDSGRSPGIVGGLVLLISSAFPDVLLILASGLGASRAEAQEDVLVGMGLLAGSSVLVLTALWGVCLIVGRCDLVEHQSNGTLVAKERTLTKGFSLTETGITNDNQAKWTSWIMMATLLPYLVAQTPLLFGLDIQGNVFIAIAAVIAILNLCGYCIYDLLAPDPWIQEKRIMYAHRSYRKNHALYRVHHLLRKLGWRSLFKDGEPDEDALKELFDHFDQDKDNQLIEQELKHFIFSLESLRPNGQVPSDDELQGWMLEFDISRDGKVSRKEFLQGIKTWMKAAIERSPSYKKKAMESAGSNSGHYLDAEAQSESLLDTALLEDDPDDDESEDDEILKAHSIRYIVTKGVGFMVAGVVVAATFAKPLVDAIVGFSKASGISPFFVSFIVTALACSSSGAIPSLIFAKSKRKKNISMIFSQIYGAVIMKNTMCLGVLLAIMYFRNLVWDFSAEVVMIFLATVIMGSVAAVRTTFPLWMAFIGLALYPVSIALVVYLDYVCGWH